MIPAMSRLFKKTLLFMVLAFGIIAVVSSLYASLDLRQRMTREFESKGLAIARSIAGSSVDLLLSGDAAAIQSAIDQYLGIEGVAYVLVASRHGDVLAHTFVPEVPESIVGALWDIRVHNKGRLKAPVVKTLSLAGLGEVIQISYPALAGEAGSVHIGMDKSIIDRLIRTSILNLLALTAVAFFLCVVAAYYHTNAISMPLLRLTEYARRVHEHDFSSPPNLEPRDDEVGELAEAFKTTAEELASFISGLEQSVHEATSELQDALATVSALLRSMPDGLFLADPDGTIVQANPALAEMLGAEDLDVLEGMRASDVVGTAPLALLKSKGQEKPESTTAEVTVHRLDGGTVPAEASLAVLLLGGRPHVVGIVRDITERKEVERTLREAHDELERRVERRTEELSRANEKLTSEIAERRIAEAALRSAEAKYRGIFENAVEGIFQLSSQGRYVDVNPALARLYGYATPQEFLHAAAQDPGRLEVDAALEKEFLSQLQNRGEIRSFETQARRKDGRIVWISRNARASRDDEGFVLGYEGTVEDVTQRKEAESRLMHQAFHDPLTGLPNRTLFSDHMRLAMERARRNPGYLFAVLYMDLDRFKIINDSLGHGVGDELLKHVARQLEAAVRTMDTVARFGGDEFAVLLEDFKHPREVIMISKRILSAVKTPAHLGGYDVHTSASIGIVMLTEDYTRPDLILRDADTAMYHAKEAGKSRFKVFNRRMHEQAVRLLKLETDLRRSVDNKEFTLLFQPMLEIATGKLAGFEALVRWNHPERGLLAPGEFIHVAEDTGLIFTLGEWVIDTVGDTLSDWEQRFGNKAPIGISVNLSAKQFAQPSLNAHIGTVLERTGIDPASMRLEITESVLMDHASTAIDLLEQLRSHGISLAMDDFGTGYSSLSYLRQFPIDALKIDRSFISRCDVDDEARVIVRSILTLAHTLGIAAVAEGVDTTAQLTTLRELGCSYAQGYLFSRPLTRERAEALLETPASLLPETSETEGI